MLKTKREEKYALQGYIDEQKQIIVKKKILCIFLGRCNLRVRQIVTRSYQLVKKLEQLSAHPWLPP